MKESLAVAAAIVSVAAMAGCGSQDHPAAAKTPEVELGATSATTPPSSPRPPRRRSPRPSPARARHRSAPVRPAITQWPIPFPASRRREMVAYAARHYGVDSDRLDPKVIVEHYTATPTAKAAYDIFAADKPDVELHELPAVCSHFVIDRDGTIYQLVPLGLMCRHTVGLNDVAIGIEHVGSSDSQVLGDRTQLRASLKLTTWLRCRYGIAITNVIGHNESLSSPYHHENVAALRTQTHPDFARASMDSYRSMLPAHCG